MRRFLDRLYGAAGLLAGLCTIGVLSFRAGGHHRPPSGLEHTRHRRLCRVFHGAAGFLALASTFKHGEHIRVTLLLNALSAPGHRRLDIFALCVGAILAAAFAWFSVKLAHDSWLFNDISTANDATPLWIPQLTMAAGTILFFIALLDELVRRVRGQGFAKSQQIHE